MNTDRIKEIQQETGYPESVSVQQALLKVWNETEQEQLHTGAVSHRRELLAAFQRDYNKRNFEDSQIVDQDIELFLAANCG